MRVSLAAILPLIYCLGPPAPAGSPPRADATGNSRPGQVTTAPSVELPRDITELYRLVKRFDFDERRLGNYEPTPMHWERLTGPGLPAYAMGAFDETVGHAAPPSFKLGIDTGSVGYEYREMDLPIVADSDYVVVGYCRTHGLHRAAAFLVTELVDQFGDPIEHTQSVSNLIRSTQDNRPDWQRIELRTSTNDPHAFALRLQLWVLQDHVWREPAPDDPDPIIRSEVTASAWFDDIAIYRMPRIRASLSDPTGIVAFGESPRFDLVLNIAAAQRLSVELDIRDTDRQIVQSLRREIVGEERRNARADTYRFDAPPAPLRDDSFEQVLSFTASALEPGAYEATLRVLGRSEALLEQRLRFVVLAPATPALPRATDMGVTITEPDGVNAVALVKLLQVLHCNAVKIEIPFPATEPSEDADPGPLQLTQLARELVQHHIEVIGVLRGQSGIYGDGLQSLRSSAFTDRLWARRLNPLLAQLGGLISTWQLGTEPVELRDGGWETAQTAGVRRHFRRFLSLPELSMPWSILSTAPSSGDIASLWVTADTPTLALGPLLEDALLMNREHAWLQLENPRNTDADWRRIELARRITIAKAVSPRCLFVPAPFEPVSGGNNNVWQPSEDFPIIRTVFNLLAGRKAVEVLHPTPESIMIFFDSPAGGCAVGWTWRDRPLTDRFEYSFGPGASAVDARGAALPLEVHDGKTVVQLRPEPTFIYGIDVALTRLAASFHVSPTLIEPHRSDSAPVLTLRNMYDHPIQCEIRSRAPTNWKIEPDLARFQLDPGEELSQPYVLTAPPRRFANTLAFAFDVQLTTPTVATLHFDVPMTVSLRDLSMTATARRESGKTLVEQSLTNRSNQTVSFSAYLDPPGGRRQEADIVNLKPGETRKLLYTLSEPLAPDRPIAITIKEIDGSRSLDLLVEPPR